MPTPVDPRAWNLFAGVALLAAGCGARVIGQDAGELGDDTGGPDTGLDTGTDSGPDTGPECVDNSDCPPGYGCYSGVCDYYQYTDGWIGYGCYNDNDCNQMEVCEYGYCEPEGPSPSICAGAGIDAPIPLAVEGEPLALAFADANGDGRDELVVVTAEALQVFESGVATPLIIDREPAGPVTAAVAGAFGGGPGDELVLLVGDDLVRHAADGVGGFASVGVVSPVGFTGSRGLLAGEFDGVAPTDLIVWGSEGAYLASEGGVSPLSNTLVNALAAFEFGGPAPSIGLRRVHTVKLLTLDGDQLHDLNLLPGPMTTLAAFVSGGEGHYATVADSWPRSRVYTHDGVSGVAGERWPIEAMPTRVLAGDLNGDGADELIYLGAAFGWEGVSLAVQYDPTGPGNCWAEPVGAGGVLEIAALGDHDGDGDQELAFVTALGEVLIFDGG